jgi:hypothetical protein
LKLRKNLKNLKKDLLIYSHSHHRVLLNSLLLAHLHHLHPLVFLLPHPLPLDYLLCLLLLDHLVNEFPASDSKFAYA